MFHYMCTSNFNQHFDGLMQWRCNSIAKTLGLHLCCIKSFIYNAFSHWPTKHSWDMDTKKNWDIQSGDTHALVHNCLLKSKNVQKLLLYKVVVVCGSPHLYSLTLNVRGPSYLGLSKSISWLLMPWLLTSPGHQQPWYWLCGICRSWSYLRKDFKNLCHVNVE